MRFLEAKLLTVADYIVDRIHRENQGTVFLLTGGYAMHLNDALKRYGKQDYLCCLHEQAVAMAADGYAKRSGKLGAAYLTAGPGAINALTGVAGSYVDSSPCLFVVGQLKTDHLRVKGPRQFGFQGFDTLALAKGATKYAVLIEDKAQVKYELGKCISLAKSGRRGPVWMEVPLDIQGAPFDPDEYEDYVPPPNRSRLDPAVVTQVATLLRQSRRPCLLVGAGVRASGAVDELNDLISRCQLPVLTSRNGMDVVGSDNPRFIGRPGIYGSRPANFAVEACDLLIAIGTRLEVLVVGHDFDRFATNAKKVVVDCDPAELAKPSTQANLLIEADAKDFLVKLSAELADFKCERASWLQRIDDWKGRYPVVLPEYRQQTKPVNSYYFFDSLARYASSDATFVVDACHAIYSFPQSFKTKLGQRHILTGGLATMGYLPAAIGASRAAGASDVYAICGDGSLQMNIQELQTIVHHRLPIKLIVLNNNGYLLIRLTQNNLQNGRLIGSDPASGVSFPSLEKVATAYGIPYRKLQETSETEATTRALAEAQGPIILEVFCPEDQLVIPRLKSERLPDGSFAPNTYDRLFPHLPEDEYQAARRLD